MRIALLALTDGGRKLAAEIAEHLPKAEIVPPTDGIAQTLRRNWSRFDAFVCIMAAGIVVRAIAPLLHDKLRDPAVLVADEQGRHVVSLLSGHIGGGNALARRVAALTQGTPVITTASDTLDLVPLDLWAARHQLQAAGRQVLTKASSVLVNTGRLRLFTDVDVISLPQGLVRVAAPDRADLIVSHRLFADDTLVLHPRNLVVGIGCNRGTPPQEFEEALAELFADLGFSPLAIRNLASIDVKNDEKGLLLFAARHGWPLDFFSREAINGVAGITISQAAMQAVGAIGAAEPAALLSAETTQLLSRKRKWKNITMAVARADLLLSAQVREPSSI